MSEQELERLMDALDSMPENASKIAPTEEAIRLADQLNDEDSAFDLRLDLIHTAIFNGQPLKALPAFSWCLAVARREDSDHDVDDILWEYKWICNQLADFYEFSLEKINELFDDYKKNLREEGYNLSSYWYGIMNYGMDINDRALAESGYENMKKFPRDAMADCGACVQDGLVKYAVFIGDYPLAMKLAKSILNGKMSCAEVPHYTFATLLLPAYRAGDLELAADFERRGYKLIARNSEYLGSIGKFLQYYSMTDTGKGLERYKKHVHWSLAQFSAQEQRFSFNLGAAALFKAILNEGKEEVKIDLPAQHPLFNKEKHYSVRRLFEYHRDVAQDIATKFDKRNGNTVFMERMEEISCPLVGREEFVRRIQSKTAKA